MTRRIEEMMLLTSVRRDSSVAGMIIGIIVMGLEMLREDGWWCGG